LENGRSEAEDAERLRGTGGRGNGRLSSPVDSHDHTLQSVIMGSGLPHSLQPTLWRTCRIVANRTRLEIFRLLLVQPNQTVSAVAARLKISLPLASQYLRALESRGLLTARRVARYVVYRPAAGSGLNAAAPLVAAMRRFFRREAKPVETMFKLATSFTHPRRVEIFRVLLTGPRTVEQLHAATRIPFMALRRHLRKLETRAFVTRQAGLYATAPRVDEIGATLARLARE
jgi:DNA-binding transcriptional ArsR family regulator